MEYHNTQMIQVIAQGKMKNYFTTQKYLKRFLLKNSNTSDIFLSEINYRRNQFFEFLFKPGNHLITRNPSNNGVMKHMGTLH
ncbi:MAG: phage integrase SAM-like domain-containing protein [Cyclobacteriaceae bacterium]|nr:phage integrase SAM-like domain-containing protein [Cyclobacteriaceae bacterium]